MAADEGNDVQVEGVAGGVYPAMRNAAGGPDSIQQFVHRGTTRVQERPFAERQKVILSATRMTVCLCCFRVLPAHVQCRSYLKVSLG